MLKCCLNYKIFFGLIIILICSANPLSAKNKDWQTKDVDLRLSGGSKIKSISYPKGKPVRLKPKSKGRRTKKFGKKPLSQNAKKRLKLLGPVANAPTFASVIDSPSLDGFVPYIAVTATDDGDQDFYDAVAYETSVFTNNYMPSNTSGDYVIGLFDTGGSAHVMGYNNSVILGVDSHLTPFPVTISGVNDEVEALVSLPMGLFIDGLGAIDANGDITDTSNMVGQTNLAIAVGQDNSPMPDLPTIIGSPLAIYFSTVLYTDNPVTVTYDSNIYTAPDIHFYEHGDPCIPNYSNTIPLELRPLGALNVQYIPNLYIMDMFDPLFLAPGLPSIIIGSSTQSLFFVHSVDLYDGNKSAFDKDRFMLDFGAQVTVIGYRIGARLGIDPCSPDFTVEIEGVTGTTATIPGFYIDKIDIPALGRWLSFTNVPVILLDIASPEGGTLDGIVGMNLLNDLNLVLEGGGIFLEGDPALHFEAARLIADIAPAGGDGVINGLDLEKLVSAWLAVENPTPSGNWDDDCDIAPYPVGDGEINLLDFAMLARLWTMTNDF